MCDDNDVYVHLIVLGVIDDIIDDDAEVHVVMHVQHDDDDDEQIYVYDEIHYIIEE